MEQPHPHRFGQAREPRGVAWQRPELQVRPADCGADGVAQTSGSTAGEPMTSWAHMTFRIDAHRWLRQSTRVDKVRRG